MAELKPGRIVEWRTLSPSLSLFRLLSVDGLPFPTYEAGQYIALRRDDCLLTRKVKEPDGATRYVPDLDETGQQRHGSVTHSYSIASAPFETAAEHYLEFYVVLERGRDGVLGRFTESLFRIEKTHDDHLAYVERIVGDFTLARRAAGAEHVLLVGTGTGLAPFVSMVKQLDHEAQQGTQPAARYTLLHANRTFEELAYHEELLAIEAARRFDFVYLPSVSRPSERDRADGRLGAGRANNLLRRILDLPPREAGAVAELPRERPISSLRARIEPQKTTVLTCGNPDAMGDIAWIAGQVGMRFEKEDW